MPLVLSTATRTDAARIAEIHMAAFGSNAMLRAQFPTPAVRRALQECIRDKALADIDDAKITVLVVRDLHEAEGGAGPTGRVVAFAKWAHPVADDDGYAEAPWRWPEGTDWGVLAAWTKKTEEAQERAVFISSAQILFIKDEAQGR
ncbi:putative gnat family acetyltransferase [Diplodia seriata]|uniref:Putative gnat family acetyltransferase n=1 Tax=Diplodia seriata TaxID=420778 RepID=A0A0G2EY94_9PEZI|nr:putative gnat family acetyltransferase [Diplodia seriata]